MDTLELELPPYLAELNAAQRVAATYGIPGSAPADASGPLLIIAGAGTGKTKTLAHRVAHLVSERRRSAAHPADDLSRGAGGRDDAARRAYLRAGMLGRSRRRRPAHRLGGHLPRVGARLLRLCRSVGLDAGFTIHDRGDSADLMDLVRARARTASKRQAFPAQGDLPGRSIRARSTRRRRSTRCWRRLSRGARNGKRSSRGCSPPTSKRSRRRACSITTTCCCTGRR